MTLSVMLIEDGHLRNDDLPVERVSEVLGRPGMRVWVDVTQPTSAELRRLQEEFGLPTLAVEDAEEAHQRPKIDRYENCVYAVAYGAKTAGRRIDLDEIGFFLASSFIITVRHHPLRDVEEMRERIVVAPAELRRRPGFIAYIVLDHVIDGYFEVLETVEDQLTELEEALIQDRPDRGDMDAAFQLRRDMVRFRRVVAPLREVLNSLLRRDESDLGVELEEYFRDLYDHVVKVYEELDVARELLGAALEAHMSIVSNRLNTVVLKVSAWAAIIAVPTFIASLYGMNFHYMPELHWRYGYPVMAGVMIACAALLYTFFRRRRWL